MRIVLIGDSIRMGYMHRVRAALADQAEVVWPDANCGNSMRLRENLQEWVIDRQPDIVHFNAGIHDLGWMPGETVPRHTIPTYVRNLRIIVDRLQRETSARLMFATTTPFLIPLDDTPPEQCRPAPIVDRYNRAAVKLMAERGVPIDDLHAAVTQAGPVKCLGADKLHFGDYGNQALAEAVVAALRPLLTR